MTSLSDQQIRDAFVAYDEGRAPGWTQWVDDATAHISWAQALTDAELADPEVQRQLWVTKGLGTVGSAENLSIAELPGDPELTGLYLKLRRGSLEPVPSPRARHVQALHDAMLPRVQALLPGSTPRARLRRLLVSLRPAEGHSAFQDQAHNNVQRLLVGRSGLGAIEAGCLARARLREVLGDEADARAHAVRMTFCWWLHEQAEALTGGGAPGPVGAPTTKVAPDEPVAPLLELWPQWQQLKPMPSVRGGVYSYKVHVEVCQTPATVAAIQDHVRTKLDDKLAANEYLSRTLGILESLGLLQRADDSYSATPSGLTLIADPAATALVEALLVRVRGFAHMLNHLAAGPASANDIQKASVPEFTWNGKTWRTSRSSDSSKHLIWWAQQTSLIAKVDQSSYRLSPTGEYWTQRLPSLAPLEPIEDLREFRLRQEDDLRHKWLWRESPEPPHPAPTLAELRALFESDPETAHLIFPPELLRGLFAAWSFHERKRFVLLSGLSGTGKTELLKHTARLTCTHMGLDPAEHVALVAVAPDWRDPTGLLGYPSALHAAPTYHKTPALQLLLRAAADEDRPYFLLLDEMNLARVERYFAPFLSAMESGAELHLHGEDGAVNGVPDKVAWPANLRIGGTVNMDETTYPFSDKVLDRAFTFEFWQVDLDALFAKRGQDGPTEAPTQAALRALQAHLVPIRRHVGYRALTEVLNWVAACHAADPEAPIAGLIDEAVFAKVLPRLRGSESSGLTAALSQIAATCGQHGLARCKAKVEAMAERLRDAGVTSFWS